MANNLAIGMVIGATLQGSFHNTFAKATQKLDQLGQAVAKNQSTHSKLGTELSALRNKQAALYAEMSRASSKGGTGLALMKREYDKITQSIANVSREQRKWSAELEKSISKQSKLKNAMVRHDQARESRDELKSKVVGTVASAAVGVGVMKTFMEQEEAANNLKISMMKADGSFGKFNEIGKIADQLGTDLPGTKKDFYNLAQSLKKQGVSDDVLIGGALKTSAQLNVLLDMDQAQGGEFLAKFMEGHGLQENELAQSADYLQRAMYAGGLSKDQMYGAMSYYSVNARQLGLTGAQNTEKLLAIQAMAGQQGLEGTSFGTNFSTMLDRMNKGPKMLEAASKGMKAEAKAILDASGVKFDFWDKKGNFKGIDGMVAELEKFEKIKAKFGEEGAGMVAEEIFGTEGRRVAMILSQQGKEGLDGMLKKMREQASLQDRINQKTSTLGSALEALGGAWETAVGEVGSVFAEDIKGLAKDIQSAVEWLVPFIKEHKEAIKVVGSFAAGIIAMRGALQAGSFMVQSFTMVWNALKIAFMANPIGLAIGVIAAGALLIYQNWGSIAPWFSNLWNTVSGYFSAFCSWVQGIWSGALGWVSSAWDSVAGYFSNLWTNIGAFFNSGIGNIASTILSFSPLGLFQQAFSTVLSWFGIDLPATFSGFGKNIIDGLVNGIKNAWEGAKEMVSSLGEGIKSWFAEKLGIHSPSRVFKGYGVNVVEGLNIGVAQNAATAALAVSDMATQMTQAAPKELPAPVMKAPKAPKVPKTKAVAPTVAKMPKVPKVQVPAVNMPKTTAPVAMKNERAQYVERMQNREKWQSAVAFKPALNSVETIAKPLLSDKKGLFGSLWDDVKFGANFLGNMLGNVFGGNDAGFKTPDFNPNASGSEPSIFSDYEPLNRNAVTHNETTQNQGGIVVNFNPTINVNGNASQGVTEQIQQGMQMSLYELEKMMNRILDQRQRRAYS
ncbi:phage tail tape measure protein [Actinobacillus porcinus]|uniref:phage tail tape measure protein n=1 Tax=Actinobacillus porcinus TaxID=51048 RepID=UPI0023F12853|nr:phage tail tape measure protein [Actinobacillus porcinus]MDD7545228.1 phage tail tape measure protein [Actinobacillus porcinus]